MASSFIPNFHFTPPSQKLNADWCLKVVNYCFYNSNNINLLAGKNIEEIDGYASGDFSMKPFLKMFKSLKKDLAKNGKLDNTKEFLKNMDLGSSLGLDIEPLPLLPEKLNAAVAVVSKIPVEISCNATDLQAIEKKQKDINFIKNKPLYEAQMQEVADRLGLSEVDLGTTENSSVEFSESPFGLDLNEPDELDVFINLIYALKCETAFEVALQAFFDIKNRKQSRLLEIKDEFKYAISVNSAFRSDTTGLPECEYVHPSEMETPFSLLPDYSDNTHRIRTKYATALDLMDYFGSEIKDTAHLEEIISAKDTGYCDCNKLGRIHYNNYDTFKVVLKCIEVRSVDYIGIAKSKHKKGYTSFTEDEDKIAEKIWGQNTYRFWWLVGTKHIFGIERLDFCHREKGKESIQNFSTNIYKSQEKSAVELSIGENKMAQIAYIKLQHALIMALPDGKFFDLKYIRNAASGLSEGVNPDSVNDLINLLLEKNIFIGDSQGFEGVNDGNFKPYITIPGGMSGQSIVGYLNTIATSNINISRITGINQNLTGQKTEELNGLQQSAIESSINALTYVTDGISAQDQKVLSTWANIVKQAVEEGGKPKDAIKAIIGAKKVSIIDGLDDIRLHDIGVLVKVSSRQWERDFFVNRLMRMDAKGQLSESDIYQVMHIDNPKEKIAFLAVKEQKWKKEQSAQREQQFAQQQQIVQQQGQNNIAVKQAEGEAEISAVNARGLVQMRILELAAQLGIQSSQLDAIVKTNLQRERNREQKEKNIATLREKSNLEQQASLI